MLRQPISSADAPPAIGPYSQGIQAEGRFLFLSGQTPLKPNGELVTGSITDQTHQVMKNIEAMLTAGGLTFSNVVKTTVFLSSMSHFTEMNEVYGSYFEMPPARSTVAVAGLPKNCDVEIETICVY